MYLKTVSGEILFEGRFHTLKKAVEVAVKDSVDLTGINLRGANLMAANIDGAQMNGACLWGANLTNADLTGAQLKRSDCRNSNFQDCCLAESDCSSADFSGSYFSRTIITDVNFADTIFSCPSLFNLNLSHARNMNGAIYNHRGEVACDLSASPIVMKGLAKNIVLMKDRTLIGHELYDVGLHDAIFSGFQSVFHQEKSLKKQMVK